MANNAKGIATTTAPLRANALAAGSAARTMRASSGGQAGASSRASYAPYRAHATAGASAQIAKRASSRRCGTASRSANSPSSEERQPSRPPPRRRRPNAASPPSRDPDRPRTTARASWRGARPARRRERRGDARRPRGEDGVEQREESCDPEPVAEPVPVEQRIPSRLVGERSVVVGRRHRTAGTCAGSGGRSGPASRS